MRKSILSARAAWINPSFTSKVRVCPGLISVGYNLIAIERFALDSSL
jgi:hypothetical protein